MSHWKDIEIYQEIEERSGSLRYMTRKQKSVAPALGLRRTGTPPHGPALGLRRTGTPPHGPDEL